MTEKEILKNSEFAMRCRTAYRNCLKLTADLQNAGFGSSGALVATVAAAGRRLGTAYDLLAEELAKAGRALDMDK